MEIRSYGGQAQTGPARMFDQYRLDFPDRVPEQPETQALKDRKTKEMEWIKKTIPAFRRRLKKIVERVFPDQPE